MSLSAFAKSLCESLETCLDHDHLESKPGLQALVKHGIFTFSGQSRVPGPPQDGQRAYVSGSFVAWNVGGDADALLGMFESTGMCYAATFGSTSVVRTYDCDDDQGNNAIVKVRNGSAAMHVHRLIDLMPWMFVTYDGDHPYNNVYVEEDPHNLAEVVEEGCEVVDFAIWDPQWNHTGVSVEEALLTAYIKFARNA